MYSKLTYARTNMIISTGLHQDLWDIIEQTTACMALPMRLIVPYNIVSQVKTNMYEHMKNVDQKYKQNIISLATRTKYASDNEI